MLKLITPLVLSGILFQVTLADVQASTVASAGDQTTDATTEAGIDEPIPDCNENEEYIKCGRDGCLKYYCSDLDAPPFCRDGPCVGRCECKDGFLRASYDNDTCVPTDQCERKCRDNEEFLDCVGNRCQAFTCAEALYSVTCPPYDPNEECPGGPACICSYGYLRDDTGKCIPKEECPKTCKENEEYSTCTDGVCRVLDCADKGKTKPCNVIAEGFCQTGCICQEGYLKGFNGTCVPEDQCDQTCPLGENFSQCPPIKCDAEYCPKSRNDPQTCPTPKKCGPPRCVCGFNSHRDRETGKCIATANCPPFPCNGPNEKYQSCPADCPGETCTDFLNNATCPKFRIGIVVPCKPACRCNKGYYRNPGGICVSGQKCKAFATPVISTVIEPSSSSPTQDTCDNVDAQQKALEDGNTAFTGKFFYQVVKSNPEASVFMSAFSVLTPLALLALYSKGQTNKELMSALNLKSPNDIRCAFPGLLDSIKASNGTELDYGAKLYVYKQGQLSKSLQDDSEKVFRAKAESLDFNNPNNASKVINRWVSDVTKGKITELTTPDMFDSNTRLVIANAIYFKGLWKFEFNPNNTIPRDFYVNNDKTIQVPTMQQKGKFQYAELSDPDIQVVSLPYQDENITFLVILPKDKNGLLSVVNKMQDPEMLNNIYSSLSQQTVTIYLPKITDLSTRSNLVDVLKSIGIKTVFDPANAELSGMTDPDELLYVSDAVQEATITVDEKGSVAAAANAAVVSTRALPLPPPTEFKFIADHPFIFIIKLKQQILFTGTFATSN